MKKPAANLETDTAPAAKERADKETAAIPPAGGSYTLDADGKLIETDPPTVSAEDAHFAAFFDRQSKGTE